MPSFRAKLESALNLVEMAQLSRFETRGIEDRGDGKWLARIWMAVPHVDKTWEIPFTKAETENEVWQELKKILQAEYGPRYWEQLHSSSPADLKPYVRIEKAGEQPSFNETDIRAMKHPKTQKALEDILNSNPAGYKWNIILVDENIVIPKIMTQAEQNGVDINTMMAQLYGIETEGHITFVKKQSTGDALDASMLTHTIGHAVLSNNYKNQEIMNHCRQTLLDFIYSLVGNFSRNRVKELLVVSQFLHMRAAKALIKAEDQSLSQERRDKFVDRGLQNLDEALHEMFAVFVRRDHVKFRPNELCSYADRQDVVARALAIEADINEKFRSALDNVVGDFVID